MGTEKQGAGSPVKFAVVILGLSARDEEEGVDLCDAIPAGEVAEGRVSVGKGQEQEGDEMMAQYQWLQGWKCAGLDRYPQEVKQNVS